MFKISTLENVHFFLLLNCNFLLLFLVIVVVFGNSLPTEVHRSTQDTRCAIWQEETKELKN